MFGAGALYRVPVMMAVARSEQVVFDRSRARVEIRMVSGDVVVQFGRVRKAHFASRTLEDMHHCSFLSSSRGGRTGGGNAGPG